MVNIFLFHRDLRIIDNTALIEQVKEMGDTTPIFIFPPEQINPKKNEYFSNNSVQFMIESLHELSKDIKDKKGQLYFFEGDNLDVLKSIHKKTPLTSIAFNLDYTPYAKKRDEEIIKWANTNNIKVITKEDYPLYDILEGQTTKKDGKPYLVYTPFKNFCIKNLKVKEVDGFRSFKFKKVSKLETTKYNINEKDIDNFYEENENINVNGGRNNAIKILNGLDKWDEYNKLRDILTYKTTFLGAHLHFSTISVREFYFKIKDKLGMKSGLINQLHWRDFYMNITHYFPRVLKGQVSGKNKSFREEYDNIKWSYNKKHFDAWCKGKTGFPLIDACMRQLNETGFMHNRGRMCVSSFLGKDLHIDWLWGEKYFASMLVDYDAMNNSGGWQWSYSNGVDASPYFRIFNPWTQSEKFDKDCEYIKKWVPELKGVPNKDIHNWFKPEVHLKWLKEVDYFEPIVVHDEAKKKTLKIYKDAL